MTVLIGIRANNLRRWPAPPLRVDSVHTPVWAARAPGFLFAILQSTGSRRTLAERPPKPASSAATSQQALAANFAWRNFRPTARCCRRIAFFKPRGQASNSPKTRCLSWSDLERRQQHPRSLCLPLPPAGGGRTHLGAGKQCQARAAGVLEIF